MITITWTESSSTTSPFGGDLLSVLPSVLELDILESETYDISSTITQHTIESNAAITDHQIPQLDRVRFDVVISDSPISVAQGVLGTSIQATSGGFAVVKSPAIYKTELAFDTLQRLCHEGIEVDIVGLKKELSGWVISSVTCDRKVETAGALVASIMAQEASYAKLTEIDAPSPLVERVRPSTNAGNQVPIVAGNSVVPADPIYRNTGSQSLREDFYDTESGEPIL